MIELEEVYEGTSSLVTECDLCERERLWKELHEMQSFTRRGSILVCDACLEEMDRELTPRREDD